MPPTLQGLPVEILSEICLHLCPHCLSAYRRERKEPDYLVQPDPHTLLALCLTSSLLNSVATPYLYHYIYLEGQRTNIPLVPLLRTLIEKPAAASHVRWVEITGVQDLSKVDWPETERIVYEGAQRCNMALAPDWYRDESSFFDPDFDAQELFLELLLLLPRNLEKAEFNMRPKWKFLRSGTAADPSRPPPSLPALKMLSISPVDRRYGSDLYPVANIQTVMFLAPNLHTFVATRCNYAPEQPCPGIARIKNLYLTDSTMTSDNVEQIIAAHSRLEIFEVELRDLDENFTFSFNVLELVGALRQYHAKSIRKLRLHLGLGRFRISETPSDDSESLSLRDFTNLERLTICDYSHSYIQLLDLPTDNAFLDLLPQANLRELRFPTTKFHVLEGLLKALASAIEFEGRFPRLKEICYQSNFSIEIYSEYDPHGASPRYLDSEMTGEWERALTARFAQLGITLRHLTTT